MCLRKNFEVIFFQVNIPQESPKDKWILKFLDLGVPITQLVFFLASFSLITHYIIHSEFEKSNPVQNFIFPAITSVFVWMMSIAYLLLSLVLDESRKSSRLVFKDQVILFIHFSPFFNFVKIFIIFNFTIFQSYSNFVFFSFFFLFFFFFSYL